MLSGVFLSVRKPGNSLEQQVAATQNLPLSRRLETMCTLGDNIIKYNKKIYIYLSCVQLLTFKVKNCDIQYVERTLSY